MIDSIKPFAIYAQQSVNQVFTALETRATGLTAQQVTSRRQQFGSNSISTHETKWYSILFSQFASPFIYILIVVACISWLLNNDGMEPVIIIGIVLLNVLIGFYQEFKAHNAAQVLQRYLVMQVKVIRNGTAHEVPSSELVPGDIVVLYPGDIIPADVRFITSDGLSIDESILTGESKASLKTSNAMHESPTSFFEATNIGFSGTEIATGSAHAIVFATGIHTAFGTIARLTTAIEKTSNFSKNLGLMSSFILRLVLVSLVVSFVAHLLIKGTTVNLLELALFSCALAISVIPVALPVVTTFALTQGALALAKHKMVIKRLSAIEDLGNIELLVTDKTGTLTENSLAVTAVYDHNKEREALTYATLVEFSPMKAGNPASISFHTALYAALTPQEQQQLPNYIKHAAIPFDPVKRINRALIEHNGSFEIIMLAVPEEIDKRCSHLTAQERTAASAWAAEQGHQGNRVLIAAKRNVTSLSQGKELLAEDFDATFLGMISFADPLKSSSKEAILRARDLGVKLKILSGDAPEVCGAVAYQVGLITDKNDVLTGTTFAQATEAEQEALVLRYHVFARILPDQKFKIVQLLRQHFVVGYMGDGVNDAPALKEADVALAVHNAAHIAYEAADIIMLGNSLMVIINGIAEGRKIFANTLKYIRTTLSTNFGNFYAIAIIALFIDYLPMLPAQLLLLNIFSDLPMIAIATDNVSTAELKKPGRYDIRAITLIATMLGLVSSLFDFITFATFSGVSPATLQTSWFIVSILTELVFIFSIRSRTIFFKAARPSWPLASLAAFVACISVGLPYTRIGQELFLFVPIPAIYLVRIAAIVAAYFIATETAKLAYYRFYDNHTKTL